jgi:formate-dependent nitrite reductase membrane component NrfD
MFDVLPICYLFLGGSGAGALLLCSLIDLFSLRQVFGGAAGRSAMARRQGERFLGAGFIVGEVLLLLGIVCLLLDLGRQDRVLSLFFNPSLSVLTVGAYAVGILAVLGFLLALPRLLYLPSIGTAFVRIIEAITPCVAFAAMLYTGLLLFSMKAVHFWDNPLLPVAFVLSSLSSGIAVVAVVGFFSEKGEWHAAVLKRLVLADLSLIPLEALCASVLIWLASLAESAAAQESLHTLLFGQEALVWWLGFAVCGMLIPLVLELLFVKGDRRFAQTRLAIAAILILVGAFSLRYGFVEAGTQGSLIEGYATSEEQNSELRSREMTTHD